MYIYYKCNAQLLIITDNKLRKGQDYFEEMQGSDLHSVLTSDPKHPGRQDLNFLSISTPYSSMKPPESVT
jgi:hypothetical protein